MQTGNLFGWWTFFALEVIILLSDPGAGFVRDSAERSVLITKKQVETQQIFLHTAALLL